MAKKARIKIIVLAGGKGKRMQSKMPKVLAKVGGKSMIEHLLQAVASSGIRGRPVIVVGYKKEAVRSELGAKYDYVTQSKQLGTGHAVMSARKMLAGKSDHVLVLYGDHPFVSANTINKLARKHFKSAAKITMATVKLPDFKDWRAFFYASFSRIVRDKNKDIIMDIQVKDASDAEKRITEVNPCYFCFDAPWLWEKLKILKRDNAQNEYYLTDLVKVAMQEKIKIETISIKGREALGANSKEELAILEKFAPKI